MIKVALCGIGRMGSYHLAVHEKLAAEQADIKIRSRFATWSRISSPGGGTAKVNLSGGGTPQHYGDYRHYTDYDEMLCAEAPDFVDVILPTYLHCGAGGQGAGAGRALSVRKADGALARRMRADDRRGRAQREIPDGRTLPALLARVRLAEALRRKRRIRAGARRVFLARGLSGP